MHRPAHRGGDRRSPPRLRRLPRVVLVRLLLSGPAGLRVSPMTADGGGAHPEWTRRLRSLVDETVERSTASTANFGRLLAAATAPGSRSGVVGERARAPGHGARAGGVPATDPGHEPVHVRVAAHGGAVSRGVPAASSFPTVRRVGSARPPRCRLAPLSSDTLAWAAWYQQYAAWVTEQQAWSSRLLTVVREEVAAGRLPADIMQTSARGFLERQLPEYLVAMAELNTDLVSDVLGVADDSLEQLADALVGGNAGVWRRLPGRRRAGRRRGAPSRSASWSRTAGPKRRRSPARKRRSTGSRSSRARTSSVSIPTNRVRSRSTWVCRRLRHRARPRREP